MSTFYNAKFFNSLPIDKFLDLFKLKEIKDDKTKKKNVTEKFQFMLGRI